MDKLILKGLKVHLNLLVPKLIQTQLVVDVVGMLIIVLLLLQLLVYYFDNFVDARKKVQQLLSNIGNTQYLLNMLF